MGSPMGAANSIFRL